MHMVNLKANPFFLDDTKIKWVEDTFSAMSLDEKIGQLFIGMNKGGNLEAADTLCGKYHVGGLRWQGGNLKQVYTQNKVFQEKSHIPLLIAANGLSGGDGAVKEGTLAATPAACGASQSGETAYLAGQVAASEAKAIGVNWTFGPVSDVLSNWRNTIVNDRAYGDDPQHIITCAKAYMKAMSEAGIACCTKHFPGDGSEERDQHLVMGCNDLSCDEWDNSYGKVYKALFAAGCEGVMVGHICLPSYTRFFHKGMKDSEILPATICPELVTDLLRGQLGFNGVVTTDASHMAGLACAAPRSYQVPHAIAAGCDMFLFFNNADEDFGYMMKGYRDGIITEERLNDALYRILGLKAKLGLDRLRFPEESGLSVVGCQEHHAVARICANETVTLVKDTQNLLPVDPAIRKRAILYYVETAPVSYLDGCDKSKAIVVEELERAGFEVTSHTDYYEMEAENPSPANKFRIMETPSVEEFKNRYDIVFVFVHMKGYAQENSVRVKWSASHSSELPWFVREVPTVGVSLNYTNHLIDLPMLKTYINAYAPTREYIRAAIEKITGKSEFRGKCNDLVWCGRWDTRL